MDNITVISRHFDTESLPESDFINDISLSESITPEFNFEGFENLTLNEYNQLYKDKRNDYFMPCSILFFIEDGIQIGIIRGNFSKNNTIIEYIETTVNRQGYGSKILQKLKRIGIVSVSGYSNSNSIDFWVKKGAEFNGRKMFNQYPVFDLEL